MANDIVYTKGNALDPAPSKPDARIVIPHVCNNVGAYGAGFALAVATKYPQAKREYCSMFETEDSDFKITLGRVGFPRIGSHLTIANMIAQDGLPSAKRRVVIDYDALADCLYQVAGFCDEIGAEVHAAKFGAGLAGGSWPKIEAIIRQTLIANRIPVTIYEFG